MAKYNEIDPKIARLAAQHNIKLTPELTKTDFDDIAKQYKISGLMANREAFVTKAIILGYGRFLKPDRIVQFIVPSYRTSWTEKEILSCKKNTPTALQSIMEDIVKDYDFNEELYFIQEVYCINPDQEANIYKIFNELPDFQFFIDNHCYKEWEYCAFHEGRDSEKLYNLAEWANNLLEIVDNQRRYNADTWLRDLKAAIERNKNKRN